MHTVYTLCVINLFKKKGPSWEADSSLAGQRDHNVVWNPKFYYVVYNSFPFVPIPIHMNSVVSHSSYFFNILISFICTQFLQADSSLKFSPSQLFPLFPRACYMFPPWFDHSHTIPICWGMKIMKLLIMQFSPSSRYNLNISHKYIPQQTVFRLPEFIFVS